MSPFRFLRTYSTEFVRHWGAYTLLIVGTNVFLEILLIPVVQFLTEAILKAGNIPYVSYTNLPTIVLHHPFVVAALLLVLVGILTVVFLQFTFQLLGLKNIQQREQQTLRTLLQQSFQQLKSLRPTTFFFFLFYFVLILPFANAMFRTPLLKKVRIPIFILDFLVQKPLVSLILVILSVLVSYLGIRLLFVLPLMIFQRYAAKQAVRESFQLTKRRFWHYIWRFFLLSLVFSFVSIVCYQLIYGVQLVLDRLPDPVPFVGGLVNLTAVQVLSQLFAGWASVLYFSILVQKFYPLAEERAETKQRKQTKLWLRVAAGGFIFVFGAGVLLGNGQYLAGLLTTKPLTISHRGVDDGNGAQNTISAMEKTIKEQPDYIEMDIHETKDNQFVVIHDENLKPLTGVDKAPYQLTLAELQQLTVSENGTTAPVASFDDYLAFANQHQQKLLIEIKTTKHDSKDMLARFIQRYQDTILKNKHRIHSLDHKVIEGLKKQAPKLYVSYILPYNLVFPQTAANAYTMEETTLTSSFVDEAAAKQKEVYAWTVNEEQDMDRMIFLNVDGIITDQLKTLKQQIADFENKPTYAERIQMYISLLPEADQKPSEN